MKDLKKQFIKNLNSIPLSYETLRENSFFQQIIDEIEIIEKHNDIQRHIITLIEHNLEFLKKEKLPRFFLIISEMPCITKELRTLTLDAMLFFEDNTHGTYHTLEEIKKDIIKIKKRPVNSIGRSNLKN